MYVGLGIVLVSIGLIALTIIEMNAWIGAVLILLGALGLIAAALLPDPLHRRSRRHDIPTLG
jgi:hypothetical protein